MKQLLMSAVAGGFLIKALLAEFDAVHEAPVGGTIHLSSKQTRQGGVAACRDTLNLLLPLGTDLPEHEPPGGTRHVPSTHTKQKSSETPVRAT